MVRIRGEYIVRTAGIEIEGMYMKCASSNIRRTDIDWGAMNLREGLGHEGNLVAVEALGDEGSTTHVENQKGVDERIFAGDRFIGVLANRYSGTSESGGIPAAGIEIDRSTELHLLSTGGVLGIMTGIPRRMRQELFRLRALGLVADGEKSLDLIELSGRPHELLLPSAPVVMVCGTSAEVGKTTASRGLISALRVQGAAVAATKFSGTGRMRDILGLQSAGANPSLDFPDVGLATTYTSPERFMPAMYTLFNHINLAQPDIIIAEAGGDPIEANVPTFLANPELMQNVKVFIIVAGDVMGIMGTINYLKQFAPETPVFVTDPKDRNPTTTRERIRHVLPEASIFNAMNQDELMETADKIRQMI